MISKFGDRHFRRAQLRSRLTRRLSMRPGEIPKRETSGATLTGRLRRGMFGHLFEVRAWRLRPRRGWISSNLGFLSRAECKRLEVDLGGVA